eukprot:g8236.t1
MKDGDGDAEKPWEIDYPRGTGQREVDLTVYFAHCGSCGGQAFSLKEDMRAWANTANSWRWFIAGGKPMTTGLTLQRTKLLLHGKAEITARAHGMLADVAEIEVQEFIPYGDDPRATDRKPTEHLDIYIVATITLLSKGVGSSASRARVAVLEQGLRSGLEILRRHRIECRTQVRLRANFNMLIRHINTDLNTWAARLFDEATAFVGMYEAPPAIEAFPEVVQPAWTHLSNFIAAGGLHVMPSQPRSQSLQPGSGKTDGRLRYCWRWAKGTCPNSARACRWLHAHDPNRKTGHRKGGGGENHGGGFGRSNGDTDREGGGGNGGRSSNRNNGSSGSGGSSRGDSGGGRSGGDGDGRGGLSGGRGGGVSRR